MEQLPAISPKALKSLMPDKRVKIIDLRTPREYQNGHLRGAELLDLNDACFAGKIEELGLADTYIVYDNEGEKSESAIQLMKAQGLKSVRNLDGGIEAWRRKGFELVC